MKLRLYVFSRRYLRHPWQLILGITGIALGVGVVLAIDLTNASSERAFAIANQSVAGRITHQIVSTTGSIDEAVYVDLRMRHGLRVLVPVVEGWIRTGPGETYRLLGFDPVAVLGGDQALTSPALNLAVVNLLRQRGSILLPEHLLQPLQAEPGASLEVTANGRTQTLTVAGLIPADKALQSQALSSVIITDISTAQTVLGMQGRLSRIDLVLEAAEVDRLASVITLPLQLLTAAARGNAMTQMTRAFRINLTALSLLALVIGAFLIYNTMTISVLQRREQIATLRTLGLLRSELLFLILGEALLLACAGLICGTGLGVALSHYLIKLASRTISDLYFLNEVRAIYLNGWSFGKAALLGLGATLLAGYFPARDALNIAPELTRSRSRLERHTRFRQRRQIFIAVLTAVMAAVILYLSDKSIVAGFTALALIIMTFALLSPALLVVLIKLARPLLSILFGLTGVIAVRSVLAGLSRTQVAVTALAIAISATIGVSIMIGSFRLSVQDWLAGLLQADIYIAAENGPAAAIDPQLVAHIRKQPGIARIATAGWRDLWLDEAPQQLLVRNLDEEIFSHYRFRDNADTDRWRQFTTTDSVIVSESYAYHHNVKTGDRITLPTDKGMQAFTVAGVYVDYSSDQGVICMYSDIHARWWSGLNVTSLSLYLAPSQDSAAVLRKLHDDLLNRYDLSVRSNRSLRELSLQIFDRTFVITEVLRVLTIIIAFTGILGALLAIQLERGREFGVLRAFGMTPRDLWKLVLSESGLMGAMAGLIAMPLGITLAAVLIYVINRRSFGWSMDFVLSPQYLLSAMVLGVAAGILAGIYPAWRMAAILPAQVLHDE